jgi:hypothetical protein
MAGDATVWIERELEGCRFADERLGRRLRTLLERMAGALGESLPFACRDWVNKAAYRFVANERLHPRLSLQRGDASKPRHSLGLDPAMEWSPGGGMEPAGSATTRPAAESRSTRRRPARQGAFLPPCSALQPEVAGAAWRSRLALPNLATQPARGPFRT